MADTTIRAADAGEQMAKAIIEMVHLMYQNQTAYYFLNSLCRTLSKEKNRRKREIEKGK